MDDDSFSVGYKILGTTASDLRKQVHKHIFEMLEENTNDKKGDWLDVLVFHHPVKTGLSETPLVHGLHIDGESIFCVTWNKFYPLQSGFSLNRKTLVGQTGNGTYLFGLGLEAMLKIMLWLEVSSERKWMMVTRQEADTYLNNG